MATVGVKGLNGISLTSISLVIYYYLFITWFWHMLGDLAVNEESQV